MEISTKNVNETFVSFLPPELASHGKMLSKATVNILKKLDGFSFEKLEKIFVNWSGELDSNFIYLFVKTVVITGKSNKLHKFKADILHYIDHPEILAWMAGSYFSPSCFTPNAVDFYLNNSGNIEISTVTDKDYFTEIMTWKIAFAQLDVAIGMYEEYKNEFTSVYPIWVLAEKLIGKNQLTQADQYLDQALYDFRKSDRLIMAKIINLKGVLTRLLGNPLKSFDYFNSALDLLKPKNGFTDELQQALIYLNKGTSLFFCRNHVEAENYFYRAIEIYKSSTINNTLGIARTYYNLVNLHIVNGNYNEATKCITNAKFNSKKISNLKHKLQILSLMRKEAILYNLMGRYTLSEKILKNIVNQLEQSNQKINPIPLIESKLSLITVQGNQ